MVGGIEGVGEAITGTLVAGVVEPRASTDGEHGPLCLNCSAQLIGDYCHNCGQPGHIHRTLGAFWHDVAHSVLHFDGKIWRTLPLLAWKPGDLTRRYIDGQRVRFVSPMALFLFSVFMMFAVISVLGGPFNTEDQGNAPAAFQKEQADAAKRLEELTQSRAKAIAAGASVDEIDSDIAQVKREMALATTLANVRSTGTKSVPDAPKTDDRESKRIGIRTGVPIIDNAIDRAEANPSLLLYKVQTNAYKFSWALIPISVPFVWLMFLHRRRYWQYRAYDHTVFVTYSIAFMSLGFITLSLLRPLGLGEAWAGLAIAFVPPIHMYRQLRGTYSLTRFSALWRTFFLLIFAFIAATFFLVLLVALGVMG